MPTALAPTAGRVNSKADIATCLRELFPSRARAIRSVANFTRADATEFLALAAEIPIEARVQEFPLTAAGEALEALAAGGISGSAVLLVDPA